MRLELRHMWSDLAERIEAVSAGKATPPLPHFEVLHATEKDTEDLGIYNAAFQSPTLSPRSMSAEPTEPVGMGNVPPAAFASHGPSRDWPQLQVGGASTLEGLSATAGPKGPRIIREQLFQIGAGKQGASELELLHVGGHGVVPYPSQQANRGTAGPIPARWR